jgi:tetratricopeptide (TPR) repeat protein
MFVTLKRLVVGIACAALLSVGYWQLRRVRRERKWSSLETSGNAALSRADLPSAEGLFRLAIKDASSFGPEDIQLATSSCDLAKVLMYESKHELAEPYFQTCLSIQRKVYGNSDLRLTHTMMGLAFVQFQSGNYAGAESLYEESVNLEEKLVGSDHIEEADMLSALATVYGELGRCAEADRLYNRAMRIWERNLGPQSPPVGAALDFLGHLAYTRGDFKGAEELHRKSLAIAQRSGPHASGVVIEMANIAEVLRKEGNFSEAESFYNMAEQTCSHSSSGDCKNVAPLWNDECVLYIDEHKFEEAGRLCQQARDSAEKTSDPHKWIILATWSSLFKAHAQYLDAESLMQQALSIREKSARSASMKDSLDIARLLSGLGDVYLKEGKVAEAEPLFERSVKLRQAGEDCSNPSDDAKVLQDYATVLRKLNKLDAADIVEKQERALTSAMNRPHVQE